MPEGFPVLMGSVVVVVVALLGSVVSVVDVDAGLVVVVVVESAPSSRRRRGRWAGIWLSREEYFARFVLPFLMATV